MILVKSSTSERQRGSAGQVKRHAAKPNPGGSLNRHTLSSLKMSNSAGQLHNRSCSTSSTFSDSTGYGSLHTLGPITTPSKLHGEYEIDLLYNQSQYLPSALSSVPTDDVVDDGTFSDGSLWSLDEVHPTDALTLDLPSSCHDLPAALATQPNLQSAEHLYEEIDNYDVLPGCTQSGTSHMDHPAPALPPRTPQREYAALEPVGSLRSLPEQYRLQVTPQSLVGGSLRVTNKVACRPAFPPPPVPFEGARHGHKSDHNQSWSSRIKSVGTFLGSKRMATPKTHRKQSTKSLWSLF